MVRQTRGRHTRRRTKRTRRQRGGTTDAQIKELLTRYFPTFHRYVHERKVYLFCNPSEHAGMDLDTNPAHEWEEPPIHFEIIPYKRSHKMMLYSLRQCPGHSGTSILQRIIAIGQALSLDSIELEDLSMVGCDYPLYTLSILRHGVSWYHRMGFRSEDDDAEKEVYQAIRTLLFKKFVPIMFHAYGKILAQYIHHTRYAPISHNGMKPFQRQKRKQSHRSFRWSRGKIWIAMILAPSSCVTSCWWPRVPFPMSLMSP